MAEKAMSDVKVFYWKAGEEQTRDYLLGKVPSKEEFNRDYAHVWSGGHVILKVGPPISRLEEAYMLFNSPDRNPLGNPAGQMRLRGLDVGHTSLSVGDVVEMDGVKWICLWAGWAKLGPLQAAKERSRTQAFVSHVMTPMFRSTCKHPKVIQDRCVKCRRIVPFVSRARARLSR